VCSGLSPSDALALASHLRNVITTDDQTQIENHLTFAWSQVEALAAIQVNPSRVKCVMLAWHTLAHALKEPGKSDTVF